MKISKLRTVICKGCIAKDITGDAVQYKYCKVTEIKLGFVYGYWYSSVENINKDKKSCDSILHNDLEFMKRVNL